MAYRTKAAEVVLLDHLSPDPGNFLIQNFKFFSKEEQFFNLFDPTGHLNVDVREGGLGVVVESGDQHRRPLEVVGEPLYHADVVRQSLYMNFFELEPQFFVKLAEKSADFYLLSAQSFRGRGFSFRKSGSCSCYWKHPFGGVSTGKWPNNAR